MNSATLQQFIAQVIARGLAGGSSPATTLPPTRGGGKQPLEVSAPTSRIPQEALDIAAELVKEAFTAGLPLTNESVEINRLAGGNTAEVVARATVHAPFAFKFDRASKKLAEEGRTMQRIKGDPKLPTRFRDVWPVIYAVRDEAPYAYLMEFFPKEDGWLSLEDRLYPLSPSNAEAVRLIHAVLDILFEGYEASVDKRNLPSLWTDYYERIKERLTKTAAYDDRFASRRLTVQGIQLKPWRQYLDILERHFDYLKKITPEFSTVTHGDPNPGNVMLRTTTQSVELKLIDPKEWMTGDYLFDIAKLTHFFEGTGPVEKPAEGEPARAEFRVDGARAELTYAFGTPAWTSALVEACLERVKRFAADPEHADPHWRARYELGMAANLLGLPLGRLTNKKKFRPDAALILYGEGLKWLDQFCARLEPPENAGAKAVVYASPLEIEPAPLREAREWVRMRVPGVRDGVDRRGFQLLQWESPRPNDVGKSAELSLEHEARLVPTNDAALQRLLETLQRSEGRMVGEHILPGDERFSGLLLRRYRRGSGPQSVDRYFDVPSSSGQLTLIPRMITVRDRVKSSKFMTWNSANPQMHPLNLEMPFVALGGRGMTVRLEFNWIDNLSECLRDASSSETDRHARLRNPLFVASQLLSFAIDGLEPVVEHTTYRQKFGFWRPDTTGGAAEEEVLALNVDHVTAQDLDTGRTGTYADVDISGFKRVDEAELKALTAFAEAVADQFELRPNCVTKAWRDAEVTGLLGRLKDA